MNAEFVMVASKSVYTLQPVVQPVVKNVYTLQPVVKPVERNVLIIYIINKLINRVDFYNRLTFCHPSG